MFGWIYYDDTASPESSAPAQAPCGLFAPDPAFQKLDTAKLLAMVPCAAESVLRCRRAAVELGRRAADDPALPTEVATLIRGPASRSLITIGAKHHSLWRSEESEVGHELRGGVDDLDSCLECLGRFLGGCLLGGVKRVL
jgi:hypothetical protein